MAEPRKIVLVLGNGFDLDLGLKTSYKDFWESEFCPKDYPAPLIHHLNQCWPDSLDAVKWYDLENELLNYYISIREPNSPADILTKEEKEFLEYFQPYKWSYGLYKDKSALIQSLVEKGIIVFRDRSFHPLSVPYQDDILNMPTWRDRKALQLIKDGLCNYLRSIDNSQPTSDSVASYLLLAMTESAEVGEAISIYSFNYTHLQLPVNYLDNISVQYVHGCCSDNKIIVGTRDDLNMNANYDFLQKAMDPAFNPPSLVPSLLNADEVIIFGHSLGENDQQYFAPFFRKQVDFDNPVRKDITIFTRNHDSQNEIKRSLQKMTKGNLSALYSINQPVIIKTVNIEEDQRFLYSFLVNHHVNERFAKEVVGKLIARNKPKA